MNKFLTIVVLIIFTTISLYSYPSVDEVRLIEEFILEEYQADLFYIMMDKNTEEGELSIIHVIRLLYVESSFNPNAVREENNGTLSVGYSQLNSACWDWFEEKFYRYSEEFNPYDPVHNLTICVAYLEYLHDCLGDWPTAFCAYNAGIGKVQRNEVPQSSIEYSTFIFTGMVAPDSYLYKKSLEFNSLLEEKDNSFIEEMIKERADEKELFTKYVNELFNNTGKYLLSDNKISSHTGISLSQCKKYREFLTNIKMRGNRPLIEKEANGWTSQFPCSTVEKVAVKNLFMDDKEV